MDIDALRQATAQAGLGALWIGLVTDFVFSFNPVALAAIPRCTRLRHEIAYTAPSRAVRRAVRTGHDHDSRGTGTGRRTGWLVGAASTRSRMGFGARPPVDCLGPDLARMVAVASAGISTARQARNRSLGRICAGGGIPFSVAICPFCTPALVILLGVAASAGSPLFGMTLLLAFALGRALPIMLGAVALGSGLWNRNLGNLDQATPATSRHHRG